MFRVRRLLHNGIGPALSRSLRSKSSSTREFKVVLDNETLYIDRPLAEALGWNPRTGSNGVKLSLHGWDPQYFVITPSDSDAERLARETVASGADGKVRSVLQYLKEYDSSHPGSVASSVHFMLRMWTYADRPRVQVLSGTLEAHGISSIPVGEHQSTTMERVSAYSPSSFQKLHHRHPFRMILELSISGWSPLLSSTGTGAIQPNPQYHLQSQKKDALVEARKAWSSHS